MVTTKDVIQLEVSEDDIKSAIRKCLYENFNKRDNLRSRH